MRRTIIGTILLVTISCAVGYTSIPELLRHEEFNWSDWEEDVSDDIKRIEIEKLKAIPVMKEVLKTRFWGLDDFHIIDYDEDGKEDLIYFGYVGESCDKTIFFKGDCQVYRIAFEYYGELISIWRYKPLEPISFKILDRPGCDGTTSQVESYEAVYGDSTLYYALVSKEAFIDWTEFPSEFDVNEKFIVKNNFYRLRSNPQFNDDPNFDHFAYCTEGNIIAEYPKLSKGTVLASMTDEDGVEWWFVLMEPNAEVENSIFHQGKNGLEDAAYYGWMSSRYLERIP